MAGTIAKTPYFQKWQEHDLSSDLVFQAMTPLQKLVYRCLLQRMFVCETQPYAPACDDHLWLLAGCESKAQWVDIKELVLTQFSEVLVDGQTLLRHKRVEEDWQLVQEYRADLRQIRAEAGRRGGLKSAATRKAKSKVSLNKKVSTNMGTFQANEANGKQLEAKRSEIYVYSSVSRSESESRDVSLTGYGNEYPTPALLFDPSLSKPKDEEQEREQEEQFQVKNCPDPECGKPLGEGDHEFCTEEGWLPPVKSTLLPPIPPPRGVNLASSFSPTARPIRRTGQRSLHTRNGR